MRCRSPSQPRGSRSWDAVLPGRTSSFPDGGIEPFPAPPRASEVRPRMCFWAGRPTSHRAPDACFASASRTASGRGKQQQAIAMWTTPPRRWAISAIAGTCHTDPCPLRRNEDAYVTPCIRKYVRRQPLTAPSGVGCVLSTPKVSIVTALVPALCSDDSMRGQ